MKQSLIIGLGETGQGLFNVLKKSFIVHKHDPEKGFDASHIEDVDVMHVCIPPIKNFVKVVKAYQKRWKPKYTVIHATVPLGTTRKLKAFHSPIRGVHPNLDKGIKTFVKFLAPKNDYLKSYFKEAGVTVECLKNPEDSEALKIWDTTYYGWAIIFEKILHEWCEKNKVDFDAVYTRGNQTYNEGYLKLGRPEVVRPVLKHVEGEIGGHCVINNLALFRCPIRAFLLKHNGRYKMQKMSSVPRSS